MVSGRILRWEALLNARDLGGLPAAGGVLARGALVRSDSLARLNPTGRAAMIAHGVRTVVDMRTPSEVAARPDPIDGSDGVAYLHVPQQTEVEWKAAGAPHLDRLTFDLAMLELCGARFAQVVAAIADAVVGGVLIHCEVGKDRTGLMTMLLLDLVGTPHEAIAADYELTAVGLAPLFAELAAKNPDRRAKIEEEARCRPEIALAILAHLRTHYGGAEGYLSGAGVEGETLDRVRERLVHAT